MNSALVRRIYAISIVLCTLMLIPFLLVVEWHPAQELLFAGIALGISMWLGHQLFHNIHEGLAALEMGLLNLKDGEFSTTLAYDEKDELGHLCNLYNQTIVHLRDEKHWIYQRELLLDKITQSSPEVLFLVNDQQQIVFSNVAARQFFQQPHGLEGQKLETIVEAAPKGARSAILASKHGLFSINIAENETQTWHLSFGEFLLNNQAHRLFILKQMTRELSRQEVAVWKKVIRVISHELNNSLCPISSLLHSGQIVSEQLNEQRLSRVFATIEDRIQHLTDFVQGYGKFAKLPEPRFETIQLQPLFAQLVEQWHFHYNGELDISLVADRVQLEQLLINLLKNAHESGTDPNSVELDVVGSGPEIILEVKDRGKGIPDATLANVLIPFYSTKSNGSGLGLALCREIVDAHHGQIALYNRKGGGLSVRVVFPRVSSV